VRQPILDRSGFTKVQSLADTHWRLARIPSLEAGIYALGRLEFAELFQEQEEGVRKQLIEAKIYLACHRQLANLSVQEGRLRRQAEKDLAALEAIRQPRLLRARSRLNEAAKLYISAVHQNKHELYDPEALGFEFTIAQIEVRAIELQPDLFQDWAAEQENLSSAVPQTLGPPSRA